MDPDQNHPLAPLKPLRDLQREAPEGTLDSSRIEQSLALHRHSSKSRAMDAGFKETGAFPLEPIPTENLPGLEEATP
jgi:hypothetical protein